MSVPTSTRSYHFTEFGRFENLSIQEHELQKLRAGEVSVKIHAVSLQSRDIAIGLGFYPVGKPGLIPCSDMAGEVVAVGEDVRKWKLGDRVSSNFFTGYIYGETDPEIMQTALGGQSAGVLTEYRNFPAEALVEIPSHLTYAEASTLPCAGLTAFNALHGPIPVKPGDVVLVLGTGGIPIPLNSFALQFAVARGATVIATSSSTKKLKVAAKLGAKHLINYKVTPDWDREVLKLTNGRGVDHVIDVAGAGTAFKSASAARIGGSIHAIGFLAQDASAGNDNVTFPVYIRKTLHVNGIYAGSVAQYQELNRLLSAFPETTRPFIDKTFSFDEAPKAFAHLASQTHIGKVVIELCK